MKLTDLDERFENKLLTEGTVGNLQKITATILQFIRRTNPGHEFRAEIDKNVCEIIFMNEYGDEVSLFLIEYFPEEKVLDNVFRPPSPESFEIYSQNLDFKENLRRDQINIALLSKMSFIIKNYINFLIRIKVLYEILITELDDMIGGNIETHNLHLGNFSLNPFPDNPKESLIFGHKLLENGKVQLIFMYGKSPKTVKRFDLEDPQKTAKQIKKIVLTRLSEIQPKQVEEARKIPVFKSDRSPTDPIDAIRRRNIDRMGSELFVAFRDRGLVHRAHGVGHIQFYCDRVKIFSIFNDPTNNMIEGGVETQVKKDKKYRPLFKASPLDEFSLSLALAKSKQAIKRIIDLLDKGREEMVDFCDRMEKHEIITFFDYSLIKVTEIPLSVPFYYMGTGDPVAISTSIHYEDNKIEYNLKDFTGTIFTSSDITEVENAMIAYFKKSE